MNRAIALMLLNGSLDDAVIVPYLDGLVRAGYTGVCLHPRDGLTVPYLSRKYWRAIDGIMGLCRERDLEIWFYDEFPYPSGAAGGAIPELYPAARARSLQFTEVEAAPGSGDIIDLGAGPLLALLRYTPGPGGELLNVRDVTEDTGPHCDAWVWGEWHNRFYTGASRVREELHERGSATRFTWAYAPETPLGPDRLLAVRLQAVPGKKGWPGMPDVTLPEVTDLFLDKVYRRFAELARKHDLKDVPVFQDEVSFYAELPWNREIESRLRPVWGDELFSKLAALHHPAVAHWEQTRFEYRAACQAAFQANWFGRVRDYCHANGLRMTGHLSGEESFLGHCQLIGNAFDNLAQFDIPGYDLISSPTSDDVNRCQSSGAKLVQSAAWLAGRATVMSEVFGAHGFHHDTQKARTELAWLAAHDITIGADHSAWVSALGPRKYDAPPVNTRFNPLAVGQPDLWGWHGWFCDVLQQYLFSPETLVLFPVESLARYRYAEKDLWLEETTLLETFFHTVSAASLDTLYLPSNLLSEVHPCPEGFLFRGRIFKNFVVPPVHSLHEDTWQLLAPLQSQTGFSWLLPAGVEPYSTIKVFGPTCGPDERREVNAHRLGHVSEQELVDQRARALEPFLSSRLAGIHSDLSITKSLRRHRTDADDARLLLINPKETTVEVRFDAWPGAAVPQPPHNFALEAGFDAQFGQYILNLPARAVALFEQRPDSDAPACQAVPRRKSPATETTIEIRSLNHWRLKDGEASLQGHLPQPFQPQPVSCQWPLPVPYKEGPPYAPKMSDAALPVPLQLAASFTIEIQEALDEVLVLLDEDSLPPGAILAWDDASLAAEKRDIHEQGNTVFPLAPEQLLPGVHQLSIQCRITNAAQGILERPILVGRFTVRDAARAVLRRLPEGPIMGGLESWSALGMPEGYGPVDYTIRFFLTPEDAGRRWAVQLPECIGVAEISVNGAPLGRSSWEPRVVPIPDLLPVGEITVRVKLHGSWNNIFSDLNHIANGLTGEVRLVAQN